MPIQTVAPVAHWAASRSAPPSSGDATRPALRRRASFIPGIAVPSLPTGGSRELRAASVDGTPDPVTPSLPEAGTGSGDKLFDHSFGDGIHATVAAPPVRPRHP